MTDYTCPYTGHKKECSKLRDRCPKWIFFSGVDAQGNQVNNFDCADRWQIRMMMEIAQETRMGAAATESFRNIMLELNKGIPTEVIEAKEQMKVLGSGS